MGLDEMCAKFTATSCEHKIRVGIELNVKNRLMGRKFN